MNKIEVHVPLYINKNFMSSEAQKRQKLVQNAPVYLTSLKITGFLSVRSPIEHASLSQVSFIMVPQKPQSLQVSPEFARNAL